MIRGFGSTQRTTMQILCISISCPVKTKILHKFSDHYKLILATHIKIKLTSMKLCKLIRCQRFDDRRALAMKVCMSPRWQGSPWPTLKFRMCNNLNLKATLLITPVNVFVSMISYRISKYKMKIPVQETYKNSRSPKRLKELFFKKAHQMSQQFSIRIQTTFT